MILQNVEPSQRKRRKKKVEAALPRLHPKGMEKDEAERDRSLQSRTPAPRAKVIEDRVPKERRRKSAARIGKPVAHANMRKSANFGMPLPADSTSKEVAKRGTPVHILIGLEVLILLKQTSLPLDSL